MHRLPPDAIAMRDATRQFVGAKVEPLADEMERTGSLPSDLIAAAGQLGLFGLSMPEEYGGVGTSEVMTCSVLEELGRGPGGASLVLCPTAPAVALGHHGTDEQRRRLLPRLAAGEIIAAFCLTEAEAGSDAAGIRTRAARTADGWVINGSKLYISRATVAGLFLVAAVTSPEAGADSISLFLVPTGSGVDVSSPDRQLGLAGSGSAEVAFTDCTVAEQAMLGDEGQGFELLKSVLARARLWAAARCLGAAQRCMELTLEHVQSRKQFAQPLAAFQAVKVRLADMTTDLAASRLLLYHAAEVLDDGGDARYEAAVAKLFVTEAAGRIADMAVQLHGAMGLARGHPIERLYRDVRAYRIVDGASDIQRLIIASRLRKHGLGESIFPGGRIAA